jgi:hypothetical protein
MQQTKKSRAILATVIGALTMAGTAAGYTAGRVFNVRPGDRADFAERGSAWQCSSIRGQYVTCRGGDAFPYVELGGGGWPCGCVTVKVFTLRDPQGGHIIRTYEHGSPVYIFRAF